MMTGKWTQSGHVSIITIEVPNSYTLIPLLESFIIFTTMAAASIASSFFSSSINTVKCLPSVTTSTNRTMLPSVSFSYIVEPLSIGTISHKLWDPKFCAAVAEQEVVVADEVDVEEKKVEENTKLYFGNLPYNVDSAQLAGLIKDYGSAELIEVLYDRDTGKSRGFAFVTMSCIEDCNAVIENLDGREFTGRTLRVNFSNKPKPKEPLYPETEHKLFVGNLSWSVTSESLIQAFQEYGNVVGARVLYDGETGRSRGYGFVCYSTKAEMESALASLNNVEIEGRAIRVSLAEGKRSRG